MKRVALLAIIALWLCSTTAFGAIGVTVTGGTLATYAHDFLGDAVGFSDQASFDMHRMGRSPHDGIPNSDTFAHASVGYDWTLSHAQAVFGADAIHLHVGQGGHFAYSIQHFTFTVDDTVNYSIAGEISGTAQDSGDTSLLHVYLVKQEANTTTTIGEEIDNANSGAFAQYVDGVRQGNAGFFKQGALSGEIGPGTYEFLGLIQLQRDPGSGGETVGSGFTRLTLTDPTPDAQVPEPATLLIWSVGAVGCAIVSYRRRKAA